jgi:hypothetical protein
MVRCPEEMTMDTDKVLEETERFEKALPRLLKKHRGKWVVFRDGRARSFHATEMEAYLEAVHLFGPASAYVVALVEEIEIQPISSRINFGIP